MGKYEGAVIDEPSEEECDPKHLDHSVLIVGYNYYSKYNIISSLHNFFLWTHDVFEKHLNMSNYLIGRLLEYRFSLFLSL